MRSDNQPAKLNYCNMIKSSKNRTQKWTQSRIWPILTRATGNNVFQTKRSDRVANELYNVLGCQRYFCIRLATRVIIMCQVRNDSYIIYQVGNESYVMHLRFRTWRFYRCRHNPKCFETTSEFKQKHNFGCRISMKVPVLWPTYRKKWIPFQDLARSKTQNKTANW